MRYFLFHFRSIATSNKKWRRNRIFHCVILIIDKKLADSGNFGIGPFLHLKLLIRFVQFIFKHRTVKKRRLIGNIEWNNEEKKTQRQIKIRTFRHRITRIRIAKNFNWFEDARLSMFPNKWFQEKEYQQIDKIDYSFLRVMQKPIWKENKTIKCTQQMINSNDF